MTDAERLAGFIAAAKAKQVSDEFVVALLRQQGWSDQRIYAAFAAYYEGVLGQAVPSRGSRIEGAREAFFYLLAFITLGCWIVALILLADQLINHAIPSPLVSVDSRLDVSGQLATLIVAFPLFLFVNWLIVKEVERRPEALDSGVRKWLTYIALVITAVTLLGDAVDIIASLLSGDLTTRFLLEAIVLFVVAGGVFWYYLGTMRPGGTNRARDRAFGLAATIVVCALVVLGFVEGGSPLRLRALNVDDQRVNRLAAIARALHDQTQITGQAAKPLPRTLAGITSLPATDLTDPGSGAPFGYVPAGGTQYRLCAVFNAASDSQTIPAQWVHPAGYHCFDLDAASVPTPYYYFNVTQ